MSPASIASAFTPADVRIMRRAIALAETARGATHPNPVVGAILVKDGRVLATGHHQKAGGPHAEIVALAKLSGRAPGATLYVTLEPCCHTGRTGPCTEAVLASGIRRVVVGCQDENPRVSGRGIRRLRRAGIDVEVGCLGEECRAQNRGFFRFIRDGRPHVVLKAAASLDGFIAPTGARKPGTIHWLTSPASRAAAHELRARHDAILAGAGTVLADDPRLTVRRKGQRRQPLRVVLDGALRIPPAARLFRETAAGPPLVIAARPAATGAASAAFAKRRRALEAAGAEVAVLTANRAGRIPVAAVVSLLG